MESKNLISAVVIINPNWFNDMKQLPLCLKTLDWVDETIVVTSELTSELKDVAKKFQVLVLKQQGGKFADWRNLGAEKASGKWLLYVDADERVSDILKKEVLSAVALEKSYSGYAIPRSNKILGKEMRYGGWWPDYVLRLIDKSKFGGWKGDLHEQPILYGEIGYLDNPLLHLKFQKLEDYVKKTIVWSDSEANLYVKADHPRLTMFRFWRLTFYPFLTSVINRLVLKKGMLDGTEGLIDGIYQSYSQFVSFAKLWEKQMRQQHK